MTTANTKPIFTSVGKISGSAVFTTQANDYTGASIYNQTVFVADATNGGYVQRIRFKSLGTNVATVARVYVNNGTGTPRASALSAPSGTPTGTPSSSGGTLYAGTYFAKIYAVDQYGGVSSASNESASVSVTGSTGSIAWAWSAVTGAVSYIIAVGTVTGGQFQKFTSSTNSYSQTAPGSAIAEIGSFTSSNNWLYGEVSLPATTQSASSATVDIDYPMNFALGPNQAIVIGLGTTVTAGWQATAIGGKY
jgi:hypothetical protein